MIYDASPLFVPLDSLTQGLYLHYPYCETICPYCSFNVALKKKAKEEDLLIQAYIKEIAFWSEVSDNTELTSIYLGGGTPSLMALSHIEMVLDAIHKYFKVHPQAEVTLESNISLQEEDKMQSFALLGVNRLSLGVQALDDRALHNLGRWHSRKEALEMVHLATSLFPRVSVDAIYGRTASHVMDETPQNPHAWLKELTLFTELGLSHLSLYQLTRESGTALDWRIAKGLESLPEEEMQIQFLQETHRFMREVGLPPYEVSSFAKLGCESRHNSVYWQGKPYIPIGPGAHGRVQVEGKRREVKNIKSISDWKAQVAHEGQGVFTNQEQLPFAQDSERLLGVMRLTKPFQVSKLGLSSKASHLLHSACESLTQEQYLKRYEGVLEPSYQLTPRGVAVQDALWVFCSQAMEKAYVDPPYRR